MEVRNTLSFFCKTNYLHIICDLFQEKGPLNISNNSQNVIFSNFLFFNLSVFGFWYITFRYLYHVKCSYGPNYSCLDICNLIQILIKKCLFFQKQLYPPECIKTVITPLVINIFPWNLHHCTQYMQAELSIHAKNSILMKNSQRSLFLEQVTYYQVVVFKPNLAGHRHHPPTRNKKS